jgi:hypothetical protein
MTDQEINKTIAEYVGYKPLPIGCNNPPNYCGDLNAMHEAEKLLSKVDKVDYSYYLEDECGTDGWKIMNSEDKFAIINATAKQRAEAFLKIIKWKE